MGFLDKLTGKAKREEEARLKAVAEAEKIAKKEAQAKKRAEKKAAEEAAKGPQDAEVKEAPEPSDKKPQ